MGYLDDLVHRSKKQGEATEEPEQPQPSKAKELRKSVETPKPPEQKTTAFETPAPAPQQPAAEPKPEPVAEEIPVPESAELVAESGIAKIYKTKDGKTVYTVPVPRPSGPEREILDTVKEAATRLITVTPEEIADVNERREFFKKRILEIIDASPELGIAPTKIDFYADTIVREMIGYSALDLLLVDDQLEEIMVIAPNKPVYVFHRQHEMIQTNVVFGRDDDIRAIIDRVARDVGRRIDVKDPLLDARLPDGSRVNATIPPISLEGSTITIRKFREDPFTVVDLIKFGTLNSELAAFMWVASEGLKANPANILVSGGTGSGKTTTLNTLAAFIPKGERILTMEDTAEIKLPVEHWVRFECMHPDSYFVDGEGVLRKLGGAVEAELLASPAAIRSDSFGNKTTSFVNPFGSVLSVNPDMLQTAVDDVISYSKMIVPEHFVEITAEDGTTVKVTPNTHLLVLDNGHLTKTPSADVIEGTHLPVQIKVELKGKNQSISTIKVFGESVFKVRKQALFKKLVRKTGIRNRELAERLGITLKQLENYLYQPRRAVPLRCLIDLGKMTGHNVPDPRRITNGVVDVFIPSVLDKDLAYCAGMICGDGHIAGDRIVVYTGKRNLALKKLLHKVFKVEVKEYKKKNCFEYRINSPVISYFMSKHFGLPIGKKARTVKVPDAVMKSPNPIITSFLAGWIDADGNVNESNSLITLRTSSKEAAIGIRYLFTRLGVPTMLRESSGGFKDTISYRVTAQGNTAAAFLAKTKFLRNKSKLFAESKFDKRWGKIPGLRELMLQVSQELGESPYRIMGYKNRNGGTRLKGIPKKRIHILADYLSVKGHEDLAEKFRILANPCFEWVKVTSVKKTRERVSAYDLTPKTNKYFIGGGTGLTVVEDTRPPGIEGTGEVTMDTLVKNSLRMRPDRIVVGEVRGGEAFTLFTAMNTGHNGSFGTVHANDARETLVRLTSPPMDVPQLMLAALNLIIVQKRIHDRRKGTIRRVTEVAEVTGVLEENPQLVYLYEWDAATDTIKPTGVPSKYLQELSKYTGLSHTEIQAEIKKRQQFLEDLVNQEIRGIEEVSKRIHEFVG